MQPEFYVIWSEVRQKWLLDVQGIEITWTSLPQAAGKWPFRKAARMLNKLHPRNRKRTYIRPVSTLPTYLQDDDDGDGQASSVPLDAR